MAQDHFIAQFRRRTGLTQNALAAILQVNRSTLNMNEQSQRMIAAAPTLRLVQLIQEMDNPELASLAEPLQLSQEQQEKFRQALLHHAQLLRLKAARLEKKIQDYETKQQQQGQMRLLLAAMKSLHEKQQPAEREARWLAVQEKYGHAYYRIEEQAMEAHLFNFLQHRTLLLEAEEAERMVGEL